ncbi:MAG: hypothetical protein O2992_04600 [Gemmatimonadetes bacterium]|nr:hypothetical protein [Gemmatimonadota bacterium]
MELSRPSRWLLTNPIPDAWLPDYDTPSLPEFGRDSRAGEELAKDAGLAGRSVLAGVDPVRHRSVFMVDTVYVRVGSGQTSVRYRSDG